MSRPNCNHPGSSPPMFGFGGHAALKSRFLLRRNQELGRRRRYQLARLMPSAAQGLVCDKDWDRGLAPALRRLRAARSRSRCLRASSFWCSIFGFGSCLPFVTQGACCTCARPVVPRRIPISPKERPRNWPGPPTSVVAPQERSPLVGRNRISRPSVPWFRCRSRLRRCNIVKM